MNFSLHITIYCYYLILKKCKEFSLFYIMFFSVQFFFHSFTWYSKKGNLLLTKGSLWRKVVFFRSSILNESLFIHRSYVFFLHCFVCVSPLLCWPNKHTHKGERKTTDKSLDKEYYRIKRKFSSSFFFFIFYFFVLQTNQTTTGRENKKRKSFLKNITIKPNILWQQWFSFLSFATICWSTNTQQKKLRGKSNKKKKQERKTLLLYCGPTKWKITPIVSQFEVLFNNKTVRQRKRRKKSKERKERKYFYLQYEIK